MWGRRSVAWLALALGGCEGAGDRPPISGDYVRSGEGQGERPKPTPARDAGSALPIPCGDEIAFPAGYTDLCAGAPIFDRLVLHPDVDYFSERRTSETGIVIVRERGDACASALEPERCRASLARALPGGAAYVGVNFYAATLGDDVVAAFDPSTFLEAGVSLETDVTIYGRVVPCTDGFWWGARRTTANGFLYWFRYDPARREGVRWAKEAGPSPSTATLRPERDDTRVCVLRPAGAVDDP